MKSKEIKVITLSQHAKERIRQRTGIESESVATAWVREAIKTAKDSKPEGRKIHYITDQFEIVCDGTKVVTVRPTTSSNPYTEYISGMIRKETERLLIAKQTELRKAEITVCEKQLSYLKAKNPNTIELISKQLTSAIDAKERIVDAIYQLKAAAKQYGIEI